MMKHHADAGSDLRQIAVAHDDAGTIDADPLAVQVDLPGVGAFKPVDTAQQCRFARPGRSKHADRITLVDLEADVGEDLDIAYLFSHPAATENLFDFCHRSS